MRRRHTASSMVFLLMVVFQLLTFSLQTLNAEMLSATSYKFDTEVDFSSLSWGNGDSYSLFSGRVDHSVVDINYPGNGLPIVVRRTMALSGPEITSGYSNISSLVNIDVPHLTFISNDQNGAPHLCSGYMAPYTGSRIISPLTFRVDGAKIDFVVGNSFGFDFPAGVKATNKDGWMIKCDGANYVVYSPTGMIYKTDHFIVSGKDKVYETRIQIPSATVGVSPNAA